MQKQRLGRLGMAAFGLVLTASQAAAEPWQPPRGGHTAEEYRRNATHWEMAFLALSVVDTVQSAECISHHRCREGNPLLGHHPSVGRLLLTRGVGDLAHYGIFRYLNARNPIQARSWAIGSTIVQGGVVALNVRYAF